MPLALHPSDCLEPLTLGREAAQLVAEVPAAMMIILRGIPRGKCRSGLLVRAGDSLHEIAFWLVRPQMAWLGMPVGFMACKRSGVRIPIAPPFFVSVFGN